MIAKSQQGRAVIPARTPVRVRVVLIMADLIAVLIIWGNLKPHASEALAHVVIP
ncbi:hypothetical protein [Specibacter cremeus]|uniref:hypothetical protein n=1 Tax=Specibacter cremeus TaxID=1629051 RepID=UPI0013DDB062|nr:hypothetical protein [Specibacter cremeus]